MRHTKIWLCTSKSLARYSGVSYRRLSVSGICRAARPAIRNPRNPPSSESKPFTGNPAGHS